MKFHSSNLPVTPMEGYSNAYYYENRYIPSASVHDFDTPSNPNDTNEEKDHENEDDDKDYYIENGRVLRYETITMTSPVLSSSRLQQRKTTITSPEQKPRKRYVTTKDVNELNDKLQSLLLNNKEDEEKQDDDEVKTKSSTTKVPMVVELSKKDQVTTTYFGRCSMMIYNSMTNNFVEVVRSARLAMTTTTTTTMSS